MFLTKNKKYGKDQIAIIRELNMRFNFYPIYWISIFILSINLSSHLSHMSVSLSLTTWTVQTLWPHTLPELYKLSDRPFHTQWLLLFLDPWLHDLWSWRVLLKMSPRTISGEYSLRWGWWTMWKSFVLIVAWLCLYRLLTVSYSLVNMWFIWTYSLFSLSDHLCLLYFIYHLNFFVIIYQEFCAIFLVFFYFSDQLT